MSRLSETQQRYLLESLPTARKIAVKNYCCACEQHGDGIKTIVKKVAKFLGPIAKSVGPKVLKEFILPLLMKKAREHYGVGLSPAGGSLKLAGQGRKNTPWIDHCKKVAKTHGISYKDAMKIASLTYKK